jgi:hypothetical protein
MFCLSTAAVAQSSKELSVLASNVESDGSDPDVIAKQLSELNGYDVYCLSEVDDDEFDTFRKAVPQGFVAVNSKSGGGDRLQILFNGNRFDLLEQKELSQHRNFELNNGKHRSPMYVRLKEKTAGVEFIVMTNHLARGES